MAGVGVGLRFKMTGGCRVCVGNRTSISISDIHHHEIYHHISKSKRKKSMEGREVARHYIVLVLIIYTWHTFDTNYR